MRYALIAMLFLSLGLIVGAHWEDNVLADTCSKNGYAKGVTTDGAFICTVVTAKDLLDQQTQEDQGNGYQQL